MRCNLLACAIAASLGLAGLLAANPAHAADGKGETRHGVTVDADELQALKAQLAALQARVDELQTRTDAQSDINVADAQAADAAKDTQGKVDKLARQVNDTTFAGKMFFDLTHVDQQDNGQDTNATGSGFDVKRFYLSVTHQFDETWSANLTTDFQYVPSLDSAADIYVKKAYLQGRFSDAFVGRIGSSDLPWIPYTEKYYGFRYVENTLVDRLKFGTSADWGLHAGGNMADGKLDYAVSVVNGGGYKNTTRSKGMDVEGRIGFSPVDGLVIAAGGYSGTLARDTGNVDAQHTATRGDLMIAYMNDRFRFGGEYFQARNWGNLVLSPLSDKAAGYSLWGSVALGAKATLFARYDRADLSKDLDPDLQDTYYDIGVEFPIRKGIKLAAVYKNDHRQDDAAIDLQTREFGMWGEVSF